jgi:hypothetical protein
MSAALEGLPERQTVHWRPLVDERRLRRTAALWTATTTAHVVPFIGAGAVLFAVQPRPKAPRAGPRAERVSVGLLGDLIGHEARDLHARTGLVLERAALGVWLIGPAGALLVRPGGRRVHCYCVRVNDPELPSGDRIAHLLLALRSDERGFATVANLAFSGARWRVRRRLDKTVRPALDAAAEAARALDRVSTA